MSGGKIINALVGLIVGIAGGLIGLGGAELRLPYLIGTLRLPPHDAVKVNLAVSLFTVVAAIPARFIALGQANISNYLPYVIAVAVGAVIAAYMGAESAETALAVGAVPYHLRPLAGPWNWAVH